MTEQLQAFRIRLFPAEKLPAPDRLALAEVGRILTEIYLGRATKKHLDDLHAAIEALPASEHSFAISLRTSLDKARNNWLMHVRENICNASICFAPRIVPCQQACPSHIDIPSMIAHIGHKNHEQSLSVLLKDTPLPQSCGIVCPAPCKNACVQSTLSEPVLIKPMKALAARLSPDYPEQKTALPTGKKTAIIGAGPAGLTAAFYLVQKGHQADIFDERAEPGGTMRYGIPSYRLPNETLQHEIDQLRKMGAGIHTGYKVADVRAFQNQGYDATLVAIGLQLSRRLGIEGDDLPFVIGGMDFLSAVRSGKDPRVGPHVVVIGGGNVAIDVAMTSLRQGAARVQVWYRRSRRDMPASPHEVEMALAEGVELVEYWAPVRITPENIIEFSRSQYAPDAKSALPVSIRADHIIAGIGQDADLSLLNGSRIRTEYGNIIASPVTLETDEPGIFSAGDVQHGANTVIAAIGAGKRVAEAIDAWLMNREMDLSSLLPLHRDDVPFLAVDPSLRISPARTHVREKDPDTRKSSHEFIQYDWDEDEAAAEAGRCLRCDICIGCGLCEIVCIQVGAEALKMADVGNRRRVFADLMRPASRCIGCGACASVCPTGAIRVENRDGYRITEITGTVVRSQLLQICTGCSAPYAPRVMLESAHMLAKGAFESGICPECFRARAAQQLGDMRSI